MLFFKVPKCNGTVPWVNVPPPMPLQSLPLVSFYVCPRDKFLSAQRNAIKFDSSGMHYMTIVQCKRCIGINKSLAGICSGFPYETQVVKKTDETEEK